MAAASADLSPSTSFPTIASEPAPVAQLDRASDFGSEGWGFESLRACSSRWLPSSRGTAPPPVIKAICRGLKRSLILERFPTMTHLQSHLETMEW